MDNETPNGLHSFAETLFIMTMKVAHHLDEEDNMFLKFHYELSGTFGISEIVIEWAKEFERINKDRAWDGEFLDEAHAFVESKLNQLN